MSGPLFGWLAFAVIVVAMLALDLAVFHRRAHEVSLKEAAIWSAVWIALSLAFAGGLALLRGPATGLEFVTAWLLEKALSVDNLFVFLLLFASFDVPREQRHHVLFWGVLGALVFRLVFILAGAALLARFHWMTMVFGGILLVTAVRLIFREEPSGEDAANNGAVRVFRRFVPVTEGYRGGRFLVREAGRWIATPLLVVLVGIESSDILFAADSIPAVFGVTRDPFVVYTSNIFAILGLRALYFLVAGVLEKIEGLDVGLALVLGFVGAKMIASPWLHVPIGLSFLVIVMLLAMPPFVLFLQRHGVRRAAVVFAGAVVLAIGIAMIVLPGPALVVIPVGLAILGTEFAWARDLLQAIRRRATSLRPRVGDEPD